MARDRISDICNMIDSALTQNEIRMAYKIRRMNNDLAPEDETMEQAKNTGMLRNDSTYLDRWIALHKP